MKCIGRSSDAHDARLIAGMCARADGSAHLTGCALIEKVRWQVLLRKQGSLGFGAVPSAACILWRQQYGIYGIIPGRLAPQIRELWVMPLDPAITLHARLSCHVAAYG